MTKADFISLVLRILNEADASIDGTTLVGADMTNISTYVEKLYPVAYRRSVKLFPRNWYAAKTVSTPTVTANVPDGTGYYILPGDYLELISFKMQGWKTACMTAPEETPQLNKKQSNEYLRGTVQRPVCILRMIPVTTIVAPITTTIKKVLYYYSLPRTSDAATHVVEQFIYIPNVDTLGSTVDVSDAGIMALAYLTASTVLISVEKTVQAQAIEAKIPELI